MCAFFYLLVQACVSMGCSMAPTWRTVQARQAGTPGPGAQAEAYSNFLGRLQRRFTWQTALLVDTCTLQTRSARRCVNLHRHAQNAQREPKRHSLVFRVSSFVSSIHVYAQQYLVATAHAAVSCADTCEAPGTLPRCSAGRVRSRASSAAPQRAVWRKRGAGRAARASRPTAVPPQQVRGSAAGAPRQSRRGSRKPAPAMPQARPGAAAQRALRREQARAQGPAGRAARAPQPGAVLPDGVGRGGAPQHRRVVRRRVRHARRLLRRRVLLACSAPGTGWRRESEAVC